ncbi:MAG: alpha/beta hydrolase [Candidatus Binataceae bacterium]
MATESEILARVKEGMRHPAKDIPTLRGYIEKNSRALNAVPPEIGAFHESVSLRPGLSADVAVPKGDGPFPVMIYLHGGGWVSGSVRSHRKLGMQFAEQGYLTINVDYRLAPENPFPAPLDDCIFATKWAAQNASRWNGLHSRMAIGGDSAGANLALATLVSLAGDRSPIALKAGVLIYGLYDVRAVIARGEKTMGLEMMARAYLADNFPALLDDPGVSPLNAVAKRTLPPQLIICGEDDPLLPESLAIAEACKRFGVENELHVFKDMPHGFIQVWMLSVAAEAQRRIFDFMRKHV